MGSARGHSLLFVAPTVAAVFAGCGGSNSSSDLISGSTGGATSSTGGATSSTGGAAGATGGASTGGSSAGAGGWPGSGGWPGGAAGQSAGGQSAAGAGGQGGAAGAAGLQASLAAAGFDTLDGAFRFLDLSMCCATSCLGNNPTSPYGAFFVPDGPGQSAPNPNKGSDGLSANFRLREDEAILFIGKTPPKAKYFGFTPYLSTRNDGTKTITPFASLSETLNLDVIGVEGGSPFEAETVVIASLDQGVDARVRMALQAAGHPAESINSLVFDPTVSHPGLDALGDTFGVLFRMAVLEDATKGDAYRANPPAKLFRLTPTTVATPQPFPANAARPKDLTDTELGLTKAVDALESALVAKYAAFSHKSMITTEGTPDPAACIAGKDACAYDNRDTIYPATLPQPLLDQGDFLVVYGVNHALTNKAHYANASVYGLEHLVGVASVTSKDYEGSAVALLPGEANAQKLYAWKIARDCAGEANCLEVATTDCPTGIPVGGKMSIAFRVYLEPGTHTAAAPATLVADRVMHFTTK